MSSKMLHCRGGGGRGNSQAQSSFSRGGFEVMAWFGRHNFLSQVWVVGSQFHTHRPLWALHSSVVVSRHISSWFEKGWGQSNTGLRSRAMCRQSRKRLLYSFLSRQVHNLGLHLHMQSRLLQERQRRTCLVVRRRARCSKRGRCGLRTCTAYRHRSGLLPDTPLRWMGSGKARDRQRQLATLCRSRSLVLQDQT